MMTESELEGESKDIPPIPGYIPTSATHTDTNVEGKTSDRPVVETQAHSETPTGRHSGCPSFCQWSWHIPTCWRLYSRFLEGGNTRRQREDSWGNTDTSDTTSDLNKWMPTTGNPASPVMRSKGHIEPHQTCLHRRVAKAKGVNLSLPLSSINTVMDTSHPIGSESDLPGAGAPTPPLLRRLGLDWPQQHPRDTHFCRTEQAQY